MSSAQRRIDSGVITRLLDAPERFEFFQAMRVIETWHARHPHGKRGDAFTDAVRVRNSLSMAFPASEIESLTAEEPVTPDDLPRIEITPAFFGLLGNLGALPLVYTERIASRELYMRDRAARAFLDVFTHRAAMLFYGAWKKYRLGLQYELDQRERFVPQVLALAGLGHKQLRDRVEDADRGISAEAIAYYAGAIRHRPISAKQLSNVLTDYFRVPVAVEQFVGRWYDIPESQLSRLGSPTARLGATACSGKRIWQRHLRMRLAIGPLDHPTFSTFLPGGSAAHPLARFVTLLVGHSFEIEVQLILRREAIRPVSLGHDPKRGRLGFDTWAMSRAAQQDSKDVRYDIPLIH